MIMIYFSLSRFFIWGLYKNQAPVLNYYIYWLFRMTILLSFKHVPTPPKVKNCNEIVKPFKDSENYHLSDPTSNFLRPKGLKVLVFARTRRQYTWLSAHLVHTLIKFVSLGSCANLDMVMMLSYRERIFKSSTEKSLVWLLLKKKTLNCRKVLRSLHKFQSERTDKAWIVYSMVR